MIIVAGTFRVPVEKTNELLAVAKTTLAAARQEAGCVVYAYSFDVEDRGLWRVYEEWESRADLEAHFKQPHMLPWREKLAAIGATGRSLKVYEADSGAPL